MGKLREDITAEQVFRMAKIGCTYAEIADVFETSTEVIHRRFQTEYNRARAVWKRSLRRAQTHRAVKDRSDHMLIHLGKIYLGQGGGVDEDELDDALDDAIADGEVPEDSGEVPG